MTRTCAPTFSSFDSSQDGLVDYTYDETGNRTNTGYTTGDNNRLTADGTYTYEYDDEGNRTKRTETLTGDDVEYEWDHRNRLVKVSFYDDLNVLQKEIEYRDDPFDRGIAKIVEG